MASMQGSVHLKILKPSQRRIIIWLLTFLFVRQNFRIKPLLSNTKIYPPPYTRSFYKSKNLKFALLCVCVGGGGGGDCRKFLDHKIFLEIPNDVL